MKSLLLSLTIVAVVGGAFFALRTPSVSADTEVEQEQEQELKVKCKVGAYGQNTLCEAEGKQKQQQRVRVLGVTHTPVNTGLDSQSVLAIGGVLTTGASAFALKKKIK